MKTAPLAGAPRRVSDLKRDPAHSSPALSQIIVFTALALYAVWFAIHYRAVYDPDIWWHLRAGESVLQTHSLPRTDWLSSSTQGKPWVLYSWLFDVTVAALYRGFGLFGPIILYPVTMVLLIVAAVWWMTGELGLNFAWRSLTAAGALVAMAPVFSPRPGLFSLFLFAVELSLLLRFRHTASISTLYFLPLIFVVWANVHVQFIYGLFLLAIFALEPWVEKVTARFWTSPAETESANAKSRFLILGACLVATLLNPYSYKLYEVIAGFAGQSGQYSYISELQSPSFRSYNSYVELIVIVSAWAVLAYRRSLRFLPTCLLLVATIFAFRTVRDVWFGVLAAVFVMASSVFRPQTSRRMLFGTVAAGCILLGVFVIGKSHPLSNRELWQDTAEEFPVAAVVYVKQHGFSGPLYNDWQWGGFLAWTLPQIPEYVDSRTNVQGDATVEQSIAVWNGERNWAADPALSNSRLVIANPEYGLTSLLRLDPRFRVAYEDSRAVVFVAAGNQH